MDEHVRTYAAPPRPHNAAGEARKVGIELEVGHLSLERTLELVHQSLGGHIRRINAAQGFVEGTAFGSFGVEVDALPLKERSYLRPLQSVGLDADSPVGQLIEQSVVRVARELIPIEIVTPAVPWDRLAELDDLWRTLREGGAEDTRDALRYAFGMHLNPEAPDFEASTIASFIRAYLLLEPWLRASIDVDVSRQLAPFIRPFPADYAHCVLRPDYDPDWPTLVNDYVRYNPTRNRPLDMVPLFAHATKLELASRIEEWALVKPRPTFHYRLPNSEVARPAWTPALDWNRWVQVETLAASPALVRDLCYHHGQMRHGAVAPETEAWIEHVRERLGLVTKASASLQPA